MQAAAGSDTALQAQTLLAWARAERPVLQNLGELAAVLAAEDQRTAIAALQHRRYASSMDEATGTELTAAFKRGFAWRQPDAGADDGLLPPLYPFKLD